MTKVNKKTCHVTVCKGICLDEWDEGTYIVNIDIDKKEIDKRIALEKLFSKIS